jgi:hypothetical protein
MTEAEFERRLGQETILCHESEDGELLIYTYETNEFTWPVKDIPNSNRERAKLFDAILDKLKRHSD